MEKLEKIDEINNQIVKRTPLKKRILRALYEIEYRLNRLDPTFPEHNLHRRDYYQNPNN